MSKQDLFSNVAAEPQSSPSLRVLIVDDYEPWRRWVYSELEMQQHLQVVGEAGDGLDAVRKAYELKPDIILLDLDLPNLDGLEVANRIAQSAPDAKIIFLTTQNNPELVKQAFRNGATGYVLKGDANQELLSAVALVIRGRRFISGRLTIEF